MNVKLRSDTGRQIKSWLVQFKLAARAHIPYPGELDDLAWWTIGRHHGLPTQLLDWTTNPLVAGYFACQGGGLSGGTQKTAAIYGIQLPSTVSAIKEADAASSPVAYFPPHLSPRISAQRGLLTYHQEPETPWKPEGLVVYRIAPKTAITLKTCLATAGVDASSMMPGLDGLAEQLAWQYKRQFLNEVTLTHTPNFVLAYSGLGHNDSGGLVPHWNGTVTMRKLPTDVDGNRN